MLYHPNSPYYAQFLSIGARQQRRQEAIAGGAQQPVNAASAAQAKAANAEK